MAHWHDFNPWATKIVYVPSIEELLGEGYASRVFKQYGTKVDAYILPQASGIHSVGIRYGAGLSEYLSPYVSPEITNPLLQKYQQTGA